VSDIVSVASPTVDGVSVHPSVGGAEADAPMYYLHGPPTLEQTCEGHGAGRTA
jgi:hypothetical protein